MDRGKEGWGSVTATEQRHQVRPRAVKRHAPHLHPGRGELWEGHRGDTTAEMHIRWQSSVAVQTRTCMTCRTRHKPR